MTCSATNKKTKRTTKTQRHGENPGSISPCLRVSVVDLKMNSPTPAPEFKPKKSVALSGVVAGNTAISTVGHAGIRPRV